MMLHQRQWPLHQRQRHMQHPQVIICAIASCMADTKRKTIQDLPCMPVDIWWDELCAHLHQMGMYYRSCY